jgi:hypothetical protein
MRWALNVDIPSDAHLRYYFDLFDKDHNGFVNADEVLYGSARAGKPVTIEEAKQIKLFVILIVMEMERQTLRNSANMFVGISLPLLHTLLQLIQRGRLQLLHIPQP